MYQNVLTLVTTFSIFKSGNQIATQLGYKMVHFRTLKNKKKACKLSVYTLWYILVLLPGGEWGLWTITTKLLYIKYFAFQFLFGNPLRNQAAKRRAWLSSLSFLRFHKDNEPKKISKRFSFFLNFLDCIFILEINVTHHFVDCTKMIA